MNDTLENSLKDISRDLIMQINNRSKYADILIYDDSLELFLFKGDSNFKGEAMFHTKRNYFLQPLSSRMSGNILIGAFSGFLMGGASVFLMLPGWNLDSLIAFDRSWWNYFGSRWRYFRGLDNIGRGQGSGKKNAWI